MGTTTFEAIRATQVTQIAGLTPTSMPQHPFEVSHGERDFRAWAEENRTACFRRFAIRNLFSDELAEVSNTDQEWTVGTEEVLVAYPTDLRYGADGNRDMDDIIDEDSVAIDNVIGLRGGGNYTDAHAIRLSEGIEELDGVSLLSLVYEFKYWRAV